ncbi:pilus assembly protein PilX [Acinetobacter pseudolwoffii]|uniref:pilus assembly protein PilX n=1 Tax=Acinetobacter pseudolwoffii TaxID=2053287 RepID=UPI003989BEC4
MKHNSQKGSTLIVVLLLLLAIIVIGTLAVRQSIISLNIATNSQIQQLIMQNNDAGFYNIEKPENIIESLTSSGMFGYIGGPNNVDKELVFCFKGNEEEFFDISRASLIYWKSGSLQPTNNELGTDGYCDAETTDDNYYTSDRRAVMTQVAVKFSTQNEQNDPFFGMQLGTDEQVVKFERSKMVKVFTVSVMPSLTTNRDKINVCLKQRMHEVTVPADTTVLPNVEARQSVTECLEGINVPFTSHVTEYVLAQDFI